MSHNLIFVPRIRQSIPRTQAPVGCSRLVRTADLLPTPQHRPRCLLAFLPAGPSLHEWTVLDVIGPWCRISSACPHECCARTEGISAAAAMK